MLEIIDFFMKNPHIWVAVTVVGWFGLVTILASLIPRKFKRPQGITKPLTLAEKVAAHLRERKLRNVKKRYITKSLMDK